MEKKYYDNERLDYIRRSVKRLEMHDAISQLRSYLKIYPNDFSANIMYAHTLTRIGNFEEAEYVIDSVPIDSHTFEDYQKQINIIKLYLLSYQEQYEEAYKFLEQHQHEIAFSRPLSESFISLYLRKKLGILEKDDYRKKLYLSRQIISYNEKEALNHIKRHIIGTPQYEESINEDDKFEHEIGEEQYDRVFFKADFPLDEVLKKLKEILPATPNLYRLGIENTYMCRYDKNALENLKELNYFCVSVLNGTNEIITMYPCEGVSKMSYIDLNPTIEVDQGKIKRLSQIDKFNQRYGLK